MRLRPAEIGQATTRPNGDGFGQPIGYLVRIDRLELEVGREQRDRQAYRPSKHGIDQRVSYSGG